MSKDGSRITARLVGDFLEACFAVTTTAGDIAILGTNVLPVRCVLSSFVVECQFHLVRSYDGTECLKVIRVLVNLG